jgi:hypothetical protein
VIARLACTVNAAGVDAMGAPSTHAGSLPPNLHALSLEQLKAVAAAHQLAVPDGASIDEVIELLERSAEHMHDDDGRHLTLADKTAKNGDEGEGEGEDEREDERDAGEDEYTIDEDGDE